MRPGDPLLLHPSRKSGGIDAIIDAGTDYMEDYNEVLM